MTQFGRNAPRVCHISIIQSRFKIYFIDTVTWTKYQEKSTIFLKNVFQKYVKIRWRFLWEGNKSSRKDKSSRRGKNIIEITLSHWKSSTLVKTTSVGTFEVIKSTWSSCEYTYVPRKVRFWVTNMFRDISCFILFHALVNVSPT